MKKLILFISIAFTSYAQAKCVVALNFNTKSGAYTQNLLKARHSDKIMKILKSKGYEITANPDGSEDYTLDVRAIQHMMCGYSSSVATFSESITLNTEYSMKFKVANGNEVVSKQDSYERYFFAFPALAARNGLMNAVKQIPACE